MFLDLLFPKNCINCQKLGATICETCQKEIRPTLRDICPYCFRNSPSGKTHERCKQKYGLDGAVSVVRYNKVARKIVKGIKYRLAYDIYNQIKETFPAHWWRFDIFSDLSRENTVIQPIPLHPYRKKVRGFNQAEIFAGHLSKQTDIELTNSLIRIKNTPPQAMTSSKVERKNNIKGAFTIKKTDQIKGKTVILVDDIFTSASTAKESAKVLKKNGASKVLLYTFAHGS